jgi:RHS repeat-associated protein
VAATGRTIQYVYNGLGQRVGKIDNGVQTNYLIDPNGLLPQVLAETDTSNNLISFYVYDGAGLVAKITPGNQYYFYHYDGLDSTIAITDNTGQVVNTYCYSPEGLVGAQETIPNPFQYVGRFGVMAEGNGLYFMRARYYDPEVGRFINKDPIGYAEGMNLFAYVANDLVNFIDPEGLSYLVFKKQAGTYEGTVTLYTSGGSQVAQFSAGNNVITGASHFPNGTFSYQEYHPHVDTPEDIVSYGSYGAFMFYVEGHQWMAIHAGRSGPTSKTKGCIRTTDEAMRTIGELHFYDPLTYIKVE